jgi:hypothetical protein
LAQQNVRFSRQLLSTNTARPERQRQQHRWQNNQQQEQDATLEVDGIWVEFFRKAAPNCSTGEEDIARSKEIPIR